MGEDTTGIAIKTAYRNYTPPFDVEHVVRRLIALTPVEHSAGLHTIVLRDAAGLNHHRRRAKTRSRKRKVAVHKCRGLYHPKWKGEPAWIEIFVDNSLDPHPKWVLLIPFFRDAAIADVLFHELGHHIHATRSPEHEERENVADKWQARLWRAYGRKRYWYLALLFRPFAWLIKRLVPKHLLTHH